MRTALYRHYDASGTLLYIGISISAVGRLSTHARTADWAEKIARVDIEWFDNRADAIAAECISVAREAPLHNVHLKLREGKQSENPEIEKLVAEISAYREKHGLTPTGFGLWAVNDPNLLRDIANGRDPRWPTIRTIREKMAAGK